VSERQDAVRSAEPDGASEAFGTAYDALAPVLYRYAVRRTGAEFAEDLVAETFAAAFAQWEDFASARGGVRPWLFGILTEDRPPLPDESAPAADDRVDARATRRPDPAERASETVSAEAARHTLSTAWRTSRPAITRCCR
jgi:hypothetical protein